MMRYVDALPQRIFFGFRVAGEVLLRAVLPKMVQLTLAYRSRMAARHPGPADPNKSSPVVTLYDFLRLNGRQPHVFHHS